MIEKICSLQTVLLSLDTVVEDHVLGGVHGAVLVDRGEGVEGKSVGDLGV